MGNTTKINGILVKRIPLSKKTDDNDYEVNISVSGLNKERHRVIAKIANKVFGEVPANSPIKVNFSFNEAFANDMSDKTIVVLRIIVQIYDTETDQVILSKKQDYHMEEKTKEYIPQNGQPGSAVENSIPGYWTKNKKVSRVEGPFNAADCKTPVEQVKIGERYYFKATPNVKIQPPEVLAIKWQYRYDDGELTSFSHATESAIGNTNVMSCIFHKNPAKIQIYAFFNEPSNNVSVIFNAIGGQEEKEEIAAPENETPAETKTSGAITVDFLDRFMSRTKHGSINKKAPYNKRIPAYIDYLNTYMEKFGLNKNNLRKAHFLGQVAKETKFWSYKEDFIYKKTALPQTFGNFKTAEGLKKAELWGYDTNKSVITEEIQIQVGNYAYGTGSKATQMGNAICPDTKLKDKNQDGYNYRGRGLIQLTGKSNYSAFQSWYNKNRESLGLEEVDFIKNPEKVLEPKFIVLSAIYFWDAHNLNQLADKGIENSHVLAISNVINSGEDTDKKKIRREYVQAAYAELGSGGAVEVKNGEFNLYNVYIDEFVFHKETTSASKEYQYCLYLNKKKIDTVVLQKNSHNFLPFPQQGDNWGRFGNRDTGGDNWVNEKVCAALLGFFHSLPRNGFDGSLYFNDISANDGRNIGHKGHVAGNDIDIRYPGSSNSAGKVLWSTAKKKYKDEAEFVKVLENILAVGLKWGFNKNYAYKVGIKNTTGLATGVHQDHFHIGLR